MKLSILLLISILSINSWSADISGTVELFEKTITGEKKAEKVEGVAVYLIPKDDATKAKLKDIPLQFAMLNQKGKQFIPQMLVVQKNAEVRFGNEDSWFHNIYSHAPKFDLGRYPRGYWKKHIYTETGIFHVYCDIHPNMHSVVYVVDTPYYTTVEEDGTFIIKDVLPGMYQIIAWQIRSKQQSQELAVETENMEGLAFTLTETKAHVDEKSQNQPYSRSLLRKQK